jgi:hypothetical protein
MLRILARLLESGPHLKASLQEYDYATHKYKYFSEMEAKLKPKKKRRPGIESRNQNQNRCKKYVAAFTKHNRNLTRERTNIDYYFHVIHISHVIREEKHIVSIRDNYNLSNYIPDHIASIIINIIFLLTFKGVHQST